MKEPSEKKLVITDANIFKPIETSFQAEQPPLLPPSSIKRAPSLTKRPVVLCEDELSPFFT